MAQDPRAWTSSVDSLPPGDRMELWRSRVPLRPIPVRLPLYLDRLTWHRALLDQVSWSDVTFGPCHDYPGIRTDRPADAGATDIERENYNGQPEAADLEAAAMSQGESMPYAAEISRANPSCFLFVIDQSGSMDERMEGGTSKAAFVADVLNKTLYNLITRCTKADGCRPYFDVGVVAYGGNGVGSGFEGALSGTILHSLPEIEKNPLRIEERVKKVPDGAGGLVEQSTKFPVWFDPKNTGGTPMCEAMRRAAEVLVEWSDSHPNCYPATVIHVTDGQSTDGDPEHIATQLRQIATSDGQVLLFNLHIDATSSAPVIFPATESALPDHHSKALFRMSSGFPPHLVGAATERGYSATGESRFFGYKAGYEAIVDFFEIGTRASQMR